MTDTKHTPEPWTIRCSERSAREFTIMEASEVRPGCVIQDVLAESRANAERIVACVNACAGISTEALQHASADPATVIAKARDMGCTATTLSYARFLEAAPHAMQACRLLLAWRAEEMSKEGDAAWRLAAAQGYLESAEYEARLALAKVESSP